MSASRTLRAGDEVPVVVRIAPGSDKPGRWLWAENDTLATLSVYASAVQDGDTGSVGYMLDALGDLLPGLRPRTSASTDSGPTS